MGHRTFTCTERTERTGWDASLGPRLGTRPLLFIDLDLTPAERGPRFSLLAGPPMSRAFLRPSTASILPGHPDPGQTPAPARLTVNHTVALTPLLRLSIYRIGHYYS
jgi:hypothetical protein